MATIVRGNGSIIQMDKDKPRNKCRKWQLRVPVGKNSKTGKYVTKTRTFPSAQERRAGVKGTYTEAQKALRDYINELEGGNIAPGAKIGLLDYIDKLQVKRELNPNIRTTTNDLDRNFRNLSELKFGNINMSDICVDDIQSALWELMSDGGVRGTPLSGAYVRRFSSWLNMVFNSAKADGYLVINPMGGVERPQVDTEERNPLDEDEARELVRRLSSDIKKLTKFCIAVFLAIFCGLRRGEVCGLKWSDIDWGRMSINVEHQYTAKCEYVATKGKRRRREPLGEWIGIMLLTWQDMQRERAESANMPYSDDCFVVSEYGEPTNPQRITEWWRLASPGYGIEGKSFHDLRHTCFTYMADAGTPLSVIQQMAGHRNIETTQVYVHVMDGTKREAAAAVERKVVGL